MAPLLKWERLWGESSQLVLPLEMLNEWGRTLIWLCPRARFQIQRLGGTFLKPRGYSWSAWTTSVLGQLLRPAHTGSVL